MRQVEKDTAAALGLIGLVSGEYLLTQKEHLPWRKIVELRFDFSSPGKFASQHNMREFAKYIYSYRTQQHEA